MNKLFVSILVIMALLGYSCGNGRKALAPEQYMSWIKSSEKDLVKIKEVKGYRFTVKLQPAELLVLRHQERFNSQSSVDSLINIQKGVVNLVMDIGSADNQHPLLRANLASEEEYYQRMFYYTSEVQKDIYLVEGSDTLPCSFYHFEQTFNITPVNSMIMEFERKNPQAGYQDITLVYEDRMLNTGMLKFSFKKSFLNNLPQLRIL